MSQDFSQDYDDEEGYDASGDSQLNKNHLQEDKHKNHHIMHKLIDKNPYSQEELSKFIKFLGFKAEETPNFTAMAKKINMPIVHEAPVKDLTSLDNHDTIQDAFKFKKEEISPNVQKEALKRLIAKYRG